MDRRPRIHGRALTPALGAAGAAPAGLTPASEKATDATNIDGPEQTKTQCHILEPFANEVKRRATLAAHLALRGFELHRTDSGNYIVTRWSMGRELADLRAVAAFLRQVGGAA